MGPDGCDSERLRPESSAGTTHPLLSLYLASSAGAPIRHPDLTGLQWLKAGCVVGSLVCGGVWDEEAPAGSRWSLPPHI